MTLDSRRLIALFLYTFHFNLIARFTESGGQPILRFFLLTLSIFKTVSTLYQLFLFATLSVCIDERTVSALRGIKNFLCSTMSEDWFDNFMLLFNVKDLMSSMDLAKVAKNWTLLKNFCKKIK